MIATIITTHIAMNAAAPGHVWPGIRIHAIRHRPAAWRRHPPVPNIDAHQTIVRPALQAKSSP
jgi:hypothetical protein